MLGFDRVHPETPARARQDLELAEDETKGDLMESFYSAIERQEESEPRVEASGRVNTLRQAHFVTAELAGWTVRLSPDGEQSLYLTGANQEEYVGACALIAHEISYRSLEKPNAPVDIVDISRIMLTLRDNMREILQTTEFEDWPEGGDEPPLV